MASCRIRDIALVSTLLGVSSAGYGQTISIVSGNGQIVRSFYSTEEDLVVVVRSAGRPVAGVNVNWQVTQGSGNVRDPMSPTDANGQATTKFQAFQPSPPADVIPSVVTARYQNSTVDFVVTTYAVDTFTGVPALLPRLADPSSLAETLIGASGTAGPTIQVVLRSNSGLNVANVSVRLFNADVTSSTLISCAGGTVFSNTDGVASCRVMFGGAPGSGELYLKVGGSNSFRGRFQVTPGGPGDLRVISGDNQRGNPGATLEPLVAQLRDAAGTPLSGVPVTWDSSPTGAVTLLYQGSATDDEGKVLATPRLGANPGPAQVWVRTGTLSAVFNLTINAPAVSRLDKVSGDNQEALLGSFFAQALVVQVSNSVGPVRGAPVQFTVSSGSARVETPNAITDAQGRASTRVQAGNGVGGVVITASSGGLTQTFRLTVRQPGPACTTESFVLHPFFLAGFRSNRISPGSVVTISCRGLAPGLSGSVVPPNFFGPMPILLGNVTVRFGDFWAPLYNLSNIGGVETVTVQVPFDVTPGVVPVTVRQENRETIVNVPISTESPGVFEWIGFDLKRRATLIHDRDGSLVTPDSPAERGETLRAYMTGAGVRDLLMGTNTPGVGNNLSLDRPDRVLVGIREAGVVILSINYARNLIGVYELLFKVPTIQEANVPGGDDVPFGVAVLDSDGNWVYSNPSSFSLR